VIDNPNPNNFYNKDDMASRQASITKLKHDLLRKINDLSEKIQNEEPFPHGNITVDNLVEFGDSLDEVLNNWHY